MSGVPRRPTITPSERAVRDALRGRAGYLRLGQLVALIGCYEPVTVSRALHALTRSGVVEYTVLYRREGQTVRAEWGYRLVRPVASRPRPAGLWGEP